MYRSYTISTVIVHSIDNPECEAMKGAIETMGVMGIIPFYKDAKDYVERNDFKDKK